MGNYTGYIANVDLFKSLGEDELRLLSDLLKSQTYEKGEAVIHENEESDALYIIVEGTVKVCLKGTDGKEILIEKLGNGQFFGEIGLLDGKPRTADVICIGPAKMLKLSREDFYGLVKRNPAIFHNMVIELCERLRRANDLIKGANISQMYIYY